MSLKIAIVGCGQIADGHVEEIRKIGTAQVVAVCDLEPLMAEQLASRYGVPRTYADFSQLLERERPDVVHITTPPQSHLPLALQALGAGCHIYVEKPFALNYKDSKKIIDTAVEMQKKVTIGHTYEFDPPALEVMRLVDQGVVGRPLHVESFYGYHLGGSFGTAIFGNTEHWVHGLPGKLFQNNINHLLNKISPFVQDERPVIRAIASLQRDRRYGDHRDHALDELRVMIQGADVSAYATFSAHIRPTAHFLRVYGSRNTIHADFVSRTVTLEQEPTLPSAIGRLLTGFAQAREYLQASGRNVARFFRSEYHFFFGLNQLISRFYDSILHDTSPPIPYGDILRLAHWMDDIFDQIKPGSGQG